MIEQKSKKYLLIVPPLYEVSLDSISNVLYGKLKGYLFNPSLDNIPYSPGILRIASYLKNKGNAVSLINCLSYNEKSMLGNLPHISERFLLNIKKVKYGAVFNQGQGEHCPDSVANLYRIGLSLDVIKKRLRNLKEKEGFDEIYITSFMTYHYQGVHEMINICKEMFPNCKIVVGGIYASLCPDHAKKCGADIVHQGTFLEADDFAADTSVLGYKPDFAIIKLTRGCPRKCAYCAVHILEGRIMHFRNIESVCDEIKQNVLINGITKIRFWESNILVNAKNYFEKILDYIIEYIIPHKPNLNIDFPEALDPTLVYPRLIKKLKLAGTLTLTFPLETTSVTMLKKLDRHTSFEDIKRAILMSLDQGYSPKQIHVYILAGLNGQKLDSIVESCVKVWELECAPKILYYTPIPKTKEYVRDKLLLEKVDLVELHPYLFPFASGELNVDVLSELFLFMMYKNPFKLLNDNKLSKNLRLILKKKLLASKILLNLYSYNPNETNLL